MNDPWVNLSGDPPGGSAGGIGAGGAAHGSHAANAQASAFIPPGDVPVSGATRVRVRYCECDPMNVAHHAAYVPWLEIARTELLRSAGMSYAALEAAGVLLVVVKLEVKYRRPVLYDDVLEIRTRVVRASRVKIEHEYEIVLAEREAKPEAAGTVLAAAATTLGCVDRAGQIRELPGWLQR
jgi:acyl-CoA thioester hydrolase